ncbi:MAG: glycoside hydrolase family 127 protein [Chloroflexi bacterium]|nr:MAG: glycoside hydrolase family 127 protein [Chloroflexota bacterium]
MSPSIKRAYTPVPFTAVSIQDEFWTPRLFANRERTIPTEYSQLKDTGRIDAFRLDWMPGQEPIPHFFWDSDVAKWIEAASYSLATHPDPDLDALLDEVIALIASAQQPDGYLNVYFTVVEPEGRFADLRDAHELYCAGHLIEAAVAHFQATGKRSLLDPLCRYADYIGIVFGPKPGQKRGYCGHEEIELALVRLYHATGERRYLELSQYFVDERGRRPNYFDLETKALRQAGKAHHADDYFLPTMGKQFDHRYNQSHLPVREQTVVGGHAVRAMYLFSAMADLAGETGDESLLAACERLWANLCTTRMYITGGIGSSRGNEGFTFDYDRPTETAYAETCAAVGLVFWNHRLLQLTCDSRYADVMERALYNGVISGISLDGKSFFYVNPLASLGGHHREAWFNCACCPPNIARLLASLGEYIYSTGENDLAVHLYVSGDAQLNWRGQRVSIRQETRYPWDGAVNIQIHLDQPDTFGLKLRLPGWCREACLKVNGQPVDIAGLLDRGYIRLERAWQNGDRVEFDMAMPVERIYAHPNVRQAAGRVALQRGPVVYCLEQVDQPVPLDHLRLPREASLSAAFEPNLLDGVGVITGEARAVDQAAWGSALYQAGDLILRRVPLNAIPYYAWDNRQPGAMLVWIPETE